MSKPPGGLRPPVGLRSRYVGRGFAGKAPHKPPVPVLPSAVGPALLPAAAAAPLRLRGRLRRPSSLSGPLRCGLASVVSWASLVRAASGAGGLPQLPALSPASFATATASGRSPPARRFTIVN